MKIVITAPSQIPALRANTIQTMKMAQALVELNHDVCLLVPRARSAPPLPEWEQLAHHYGLRRRFPIQELPAHPSLRRYDFSWRAVSWARRRQADLLYTRLPQTAALASQTGMPTILEVHDLPQGTFGALFFRWFVGGRGARRLVVITRSLADELARRFNIPVETPASRPLMLIAPDGVDLERYTDLPDPPTARRQIAERVHAAGIAQALEDRFTAGYTGHLYAGRGIEVILQLAKRLPDMNFLVVGGEPSQVAQLKTRLQEEKLAQGDIYQNLAVLGFVPNAELPRYQAACEVLLMPYQRQVAASSGGDIAPYFSPMKLFEYLACGRAILCSDLPVLHEILTPKNALFLPPDDLEAWAAALQRLRQRDDERAQLGDQARQDAKRYTWQARAARILEGIIP